MKVDSMSQRAGNEYFRNAVMTASPEQLHLMLYDGAIRFARQARNALAERDFESSCESLLRAQQIMLEMEAGLRPEVNAVLCEQVGALYRFVYSRLIDANMKRDVKAVDEALGILEHQRETWRLLIEKTRGEAIPPSESRRHDSAPQPPSETPPVLSVEG